MSDPAQSSTVETAAWWEDYLEIFVAPSRVFERRKAAGFLLPLTILTVLSAVLILGLRGAYQVPLEADGVRQMEIVQQQNPEMTAEQAQRGAEIQANLGMYFFIAIIPILALLIGLFLWLTGKAVGATETLGQAMLIATFASFPRLVGLLLGGLQGMFLPEESLNGMSRLSIGPARFLDPDVASAVSIALAVRFDITVVWITVLLAIGLKVIAKLPMNKALIAAGLVWVVGALPGLFGAMRAGG